MIKIGVLDSDISIREDINEFINNYFSEKSYFYKVYKFSNYEELLEFYHNKDKIDLLFTELVETGKEDKPKKNVFDNLEKLRKIDSAINIVINTTSNIYASKCFEIWPLYYNVKPLKYDKTSTIINRFLKQNMLKEESFSVRNGKKIINLSFDEIVFIESQNTTIKIHMNNYEVLKTYGKLDDIENQLSNDRFLRCHKSFLVNMNYIKAADGYKFITIYGDTVSIRQREASKIKKIFYDFINKKKKHEKEKK